jgi:hypothetical protein
VVYSSQDREVRERRRLTTTVEGTLVTPEDSSPGFIVGERSPATAELLLIDLP